MVNMRNGSIPGRLKSGPLVFRDPRSITKVDVPADCPPKSGVHRDPGQKFLIVLDGHLASGIRIGEDLSGVIIGEVQRVAGIRGPEPVVNGRRGSWVEGARKH